MTHEIRMRQQYITHSSRAGNEINNLRNAFDSSLGKVIRNPDLDPILLEHEAKKLDNAIENRRRSTSPGRAYSKRQGSPVRSGSPSRATSSLVRGSSPLRSTIRRTSPSPVPLRSSMRKWLLDPDQLRVQMISADLDRLMITDDVGLFNLQV